MNAPYRPMQAIDVLDLYFIENRSRVLDIASFLDRIDRYAGAEEAQADYRYQAFAKIIELLKAPSGGRTKAIQLALSDPTTEPLDSAVGLKAWGAWQGESHEGD
jgi:hypothetical protein